MKARIWAASGAMLVAACAALAMIPGGHTAETVLRVPADGDWSRGAEAVAQRSLRDRLGDAGAEFRNVSTYRFGPADERAVCGQVRSGEGEFLPFVVRVSAEGTPRPGDEARVRPHPLLAGTGNAPRMMLDARLRFCRDAGYDAQPLSPIETSPASAQPAPAPTSPSVQAAPPARGAPPPALPVSVADASGTVVVRSPANLRAAPSGGGSVLRVVPRGQSLEVFARAPGGWLQVGAGAPEGWVHSSMLGGASFGATRTADAGTY